MYNMAHKAKKHATDMLYTRKKKFTPREIYIHLFLKTPIDGVHIQFILEYFMARKSNKSTSLCLPE